MHLTPRMIALATPVALTLVREGDLRCRASAR